MSPSSSKQARAMLVDGAASTGNIYLRRFHDERQLTAREAQDRGDGAVDLVGRTRHHGEASNGAQTSGKESDGPCESFIGLAVPVVQYLDARSPEAARRRRLADTDQLLTDIEELRLEAGHFLSTFLLDRIAAAAAEIVGTRHRARINNLRRAHEFVLGLQRPLMAANPKNAGSMPQWQGTQPADRHIGRRQMPLEVPQPPAYAGWSRR